MQISSVNNTIGNINNLNTVNQTAARKANFSTKTLPDTFVKSNNVSFQGNEYMTLAEKNEPAEEVLEHIKTLEAEEPAKMEEYSSKHNELAEKRADMATEARAVEKELLELYNNGTKATEDGGKIEIKNSKLIERDGSGKTKIEATFQDYETQTKRGLFGRVRNIKVKNPRLISMIEHNQDGTMNIISQDIYLKKYKKNEDGSSSCESMVAFGPTKKESGKLERRFGLGFTKDVKGNKHWNEVLYNQSARTTFGIYEAVNTYRKNENIAPDGSITADAHYNYNIACIGSPAQRYYEGYEETSDGKTSYNKGVTVWCNELYEYKENYKENKNGKKEWDVFYKKDDGQNGSETKGQWFNMTPKHFYKYEV